VSSTHSAGFDAAWHIAEDIPGWLTIDQARMLWDAALRVPDGGTIVEIGSHQGRSTVVLARAMAGRGRVVAVDPFVEGRLFGGPSTRQRFEGNVQRAGVEDTVELVCDYSTRARAAWRRPVDLLYIDGKHDYWTVSDDLRWSSRVPAGGTVLLHDSFSSVGVTAGILARVLPGRGLAYECRQGSMALFARRDPSLADRARILRELPWWLRNVLVKVLLRLRLRGPAGVLGHHGPYDPY
jgi:hypothetical protein